jgi:hypothetical protein
MAQVEVPHNLIRRPAIVRFFEAFMMLFDDADRGEVVRLAKVNANDQPGRPDDMQPEALLFQHTPIPAI